MSRICRGCGGVLGRDCFNERECMWISEQQDIEEYNRRNTMPIMPDPGEPQQPSQQEYYEGQIESLQTELDKLKKENEWISVEERLPEVNRGIAEQFVVNSYVKGADNENIQICAAFYDGKFYNLEYWQAYEIHEIAPIELKTITHWRPLPSPPTKVD